MYEYQLARDAFLGRSVEYDKKLQYLEALAEKEFWGVESIYGEDYTRYPILKNYLFYTYDRVVEEGKTVISTDKESMIFNTGLLTKNGEEIFALLNRNFKYPLETYLMWYLYGFVARSDVRLNKFSSLPIMVNYFENTEDLVFDRHLPLDIDYQHIINENRERLKSKEPKDFPQDSKFLVYILAGSIDHLKKKVYRNYKLAAPHYYINKLTGERKIQLMLPISVFDQSKVEFAIVIQKENNRYGLSR